MRKLAFVALALQCPFLFPLASGQSVISARSGLVNYFEGVVFLDGQPLMRKAGVFARLRDGSTLLTQSGRAEVLLTPDAYLRIGENSSIRMISDSIADTQVELLAGSSILDSSRAPAGAFIKIVFRDSTIRILKPGHYRMDAEPAQLRVFEGEAEVTRKSDGQPIDIKSSQLFPLDGAPVVKRFTQGSDGLLDLWSEERGSLIASNMVNSQSISDPLLDSGPGVPDDLSSYIGYVPLAAIQGSGADPYGYGGSPYGYGNMMPYPGVMPGFYPGFGISALGFAPYPTAAFLYTPRRYTPVFASRPTFPSSIGIVRGGIGTLSPTRSVFVPRPGITPGITATRPGGAIGVRSGGVHAIGGRR